MKPCTVTDAPLVVGALGLVVNVTAGASYVKCCAMCVPIIELTSSMPLRSDWYPSAARQLTYVVVVHATVAHAVTPICALGVKSDMPKLVPKMEMLAPELDGELRGAALVLAGASYVKALLMVPTMPVTSAAALCAMPEAAEFMQYSLVAVSHDDVEQAAPPTRTVGLVSVDAKLSPWTVTGDPPLVAPFDTAMKLAEGAS